ncbi:hypothetical protein [Streptomyces alfalfae]|nr:hypothetical protein [Streptomyces alfalfae]
MERGLKQIQYRSDLVDAGLAATELVPDRWAVPFRHVYLDG